MQQEGPHDFWIGFAGQRPAMETHHVRTPSFASDSSRAAQPAAACSRQSLGFLDGEKTGVALLFSGAFLALVGVTFTAMGWRSYPPNSSFQWTRLLGPILISSGGTFILTSVCRFGIRSLWPCGRPQDEVFVIPVREQPSGRSPFMFQGMNQPVVLQGGAAMLYMPPTYNFMSPDVEQAGGCASDAAAAALPSYEAVFPGDNAAGEGCSSGSTETDLTGSRVQKTEEERRHVERSSSTCSQPPAYEDIYPSSHKPDSS